MGILDLTQVTAVGAGDQIPLASAAGGDDQRATMAQLVAYLNTALTVVVPKLVQQFSAPVTGGTVTVAAGDIWLIVTPASTLATLTIALPAARTEGQIVRVNCTQIITALTVSGQGTAVSGAPTTLTAGAFFDMAYSATLNSWYRVG
jgi:hypothetical protein